MENPQDGVDRPVKELRGFDKVSLAPGESRQLRFTLTPRDFSYWEDRVAGFHAPGGHYRVLVGASSADIRLSAELSLAAPEPLPLRVDANSLIGDLLAVPKYAQVLEPMIAMALKSLPQGTGDSAIMPPDALAAMFKEMPLRAINMLAGPMLPRGALDGLIRQLQAVP